MSCKHFADPPFVQPSAFASILLVLLTGLASGLLLAGPVTSQTGPPADRGFDGPPPAFTIQHLPAGPTATGVASGDFDRDGVPDVVVTLMGADVVSVHLGAGGALGAPTQYATGSQPRSVVAEDFDGDGVLDLAVTNFGRSNLFDRSADVSVLLGLGDGTFAPQETYGAGFGPSGMAVGDVDGDGVPDLVVANVFHSTVSVLLGDGTGGFITQPPLAAPESAQDVALGDLDRDGFPDLVVGLLHGDSPYFVFHNQGDGSFLPAEDFPRARPYHLRLFETETETVNVALADVDRNGWLDLAVADGVTSEVFFHRSLGAAGFASGQRLSDGTPIQVSPRDVAFADLDGDGLLDLLTVNMISDNVAVFAGLPGGRFAPPVTYDAADQTRALAVADFNGDGRPDLAGSGLQLYLLLSEPVGPVVSGITPRSGPPEGGRPFFVRGLNFQPGARVLVGGVPATDVRVLPTSQIRAVSPPAAVGMADVSVVNPDGGEAVLSDSFDVARAGSSTSTLEFTRLVYCGDGVRPACPLAKFKDVDVGDLDGDGDLDVFLAKSRHSSGSDLVLHNTGSLTIEPRDFTDGFGAVQTHELAFGLFDIVDTTLPAVGSGNAQYDIQLADVDGDGDLDILRATVPSLSLLLDDGDADFTDFNDVTSAQILTAANNTAGLVHGNHTFDDVAIGDVDGDGDLDFALASRDNMGPGSQDLLLLNNGGGYTANFALFSGVTGTHHDVELVDIDNDTDLDAVFSGNSVGGSDAVQILRNNRIESGTNTLSFVVESWITPAITTGCEALEMWDAAGNPVDFNGDGYVDLVCGRMNTGPDLVYFNEGSANPGRFANPVELPGPGSAGGSYGADLGDLDLDGDTDIAEAHYFGDPMIFLTQNTAGSISFDPLPVPAVAGGRGDANTYWQSMVADAGVGPAFSEPPDTQVDSEPNGKIDSLSPAMRPRLGDLDKDGDLDIVFAMGDGGNRSVRIYLNRTDPNLPVKSNVDVWMKDNASDTGATPSSGTMWQSPAIWNRRAADCAPSPGGSTCTSADHENPLFGQTNYLYATVRNRGTETLWSARVQFNVASASAGLAWPTDFSLVGEITVFSLAPGEVRVVGPLAWNPPNPNPSDHFCFYVRLLSDEDPIDVTEGSNVDANARNNNEIIWRNMKVEQMSGGSAGFTFRNIEVDQLEPAITVRVLTPLEVLDAGAVTLRLDAALVEAWLDKNGGQVEGAEVSPEGEVRIIAERACLHDLPLETRATTPVVLTFDGATRAARIDVIQEALVKDVPTVRGGVTIDIRENDGPVAEEEQPAPTEAAVAAPEEDKDQLCVRR